MTTAVAPKVIAILAEQACLDESDIALDASLTELGVDSLALVESIFAIEEAFDVQVPFNANAPKDTAFDTSSVRSIIAAVEDLVASR